MLQDNFQIISLIPALGFMGYGFYLNSIAIRLMKDHQNTILIEQYRKKLKWWKISISIYIISELIFLSIIM